MEENLGILNSKWQIITLGFEIYVFKKERAVNEKREKEPLRICNFLKINQFGPW